MAVVAYSLYISEFHTYDAITANPVEFIGKLLQKFDDLKLPDWFEELKEQDWNGLICDCKHILKLSSNASNASVHSIYDSFRSFYFFILKKIFNRNDPESQIIN